MILKFPKKFKFKKTFKRRIQNTSFNLKSKNIFLEFGSAGIRSTQSCKIRFKQLEASRRSVLRLCKKRSTVWIKPSISIPLTSLPKGGRMGKGKGKVKSWCGNVKKFDLLFEIDNTVFTKSKSIFKKLMSKIPIKSVIVFRNKNYLQ